MSVESAFMVSTHAETYIDDRVTGSTRTALIRSLTALLGDPLSDERGTFWAPSREEQLREIDLKIARADRARRSLARERAQAEKVLDEVERIMRDAIGSPLQQLITERDDGMDKLDGIDLAIAQLDRDRRRLKKERKEIESVLLSY